MGGKQWNANSFKYKELRPQSNNKTELSINHLLVTKQRFDALFSEFYMLEH